MVIYVRWSCKWKTTSGKEYARSRCVLSNFPQVDRSPCAPIINPSARKSPFFSLNLFANYPGGTPDSQREFLNTLSSDPSDPRLPNQRRKGRVAPLANEFALGYTYQDILDADHEGAYFLAFPLHFHPWRSMLNKSTVIRSVSRFTDNLNFGFRHLGEGICLPSIGPLTVFYTANSTASHTTIGLRNSYSDLT